MGKKNSDIVNALSSMTQVALSVIIPIAIVIGGGKFIVEKYELPGWVMVFLVIFGVVCGFYNMMKYLFSVCNTGKKED